MPGLPGARQDSPDVAVRGRPRDERVLARAAADDENSHAVKGLGRVTEVDGHARSADYFVDLDVELRLESAFTRDSLAYLVVWTMVASRAEGCVSAWLKSKIQEGESIESALRRFKRKVQQEDIIKDIKKHSFYLKPGDKRRAKQALARKRNRKKLRRESWSKRPTPTR